LKNQHKPLALLLSLLLASTALGWTQSAAPATTRAITSSEQKLVDNVAVASIKETVNALAADDMQGRGTAQPGGDKAAAYLADRFAKLGLKPLGDSNTYLQSIKFKETQFLPQTAFTVGDQNLKFGTDYFVSPPLSGDKNISAKMYFVGYGLSAPTLTRNDLGDVDLQLGMLTDEHPGRTGVVEMDVGEQKVAQVLELDPTLTQRGVQVLKA